MEKRENINPIQGLNKYGKVKFANEMNNKYPIDTPKHIKSAWSYIHMLRGYEKYSAEDLKTIKTG